MQIKLQGITGRNHLVNWGGRRVHGGCGAVNTSIRSFAGVSRWGAVESKIAHLRGARLWVSMGGGSAGKSKEVVKPLNNKRNQAKVQSSAELHFVVRK